MSVGDILLYSSLIPIRCLYPSFILYESSYLIRPHPGPHHWNQSAQARLLITRSASPSAPRRAPRNSFSTSGNFHRTSDWDIPKNMMTGCEHGDVENDRSWGIWCLTIKFRGNWVWVMLIACRWEPQMRPISQMRSGRSLSIQPRGSLSEHYGV